MSNWQGGLKGTIFVKQVNISVIPRSSNWLRNIHLKNNWRDDRKSRKVMISHLKRIPALHNNLMSTFSSSYRTECLTDLYTMLVVYAHQHRHVSHPCILPRIEICKHNSGCLRVIFSTNAVAPSSSLLPSLCSTWQFLVFFLLGKNWSLMYS